MIVDSSALVAIAFEETGWQRLANLIAETEMVCIPAPVRLEMTMVVANRESKKTVRDIEVFLARSYVKFIPFTPLMAEIAQDAFFKFGKGQGHKAQLNFGDCMVYAAAKTEDMPLLFVGDDFSKTDVRVATES